MITYLAEGATGAFFDTRLAIANPSALPALVLTRFQKSDGTTIRDYRTSVRTAQPMARMTAIHKRLMQEGGIDASLHIDEAVTTTVKLRVIGRQQQLLRIDFETMPSHEVLLAKLSDFEQRLPECDAVVFSDYGKGGLTHIGEMIGLARAAGKIVLVDPKGDEYAKYSGATIITPNRGEMREVVGRWKDEAELERKANALRTELALQALLVTRSDEGMTLFHAGGTLHEKAVAREVFDVSGAGDTVIATLAVMLAHGADWAAAIHVANVAAGIVVGKLGTAVVTRDELDAALN